MSTPAVQLTLSFPLGKNLVIHVIINETEGWNCRQIKQVEGSDQPKMCAGID